MPPTKTTGSKKEDLLDHVDNMLDQDKEDEEVQKRLKHPFIKWMFGSMVALLFMIFLTYFLSFSLQIPLPEIKFLESFMNVVVEVMKILLPTG